MRLNHRVGMCAIVLLTVVVPPRGFSTEETSSAFNRWAVDYAMGNAEPAQGFELVKERRAQMRALIRTNPREGIRTAIPEVVRDRLPPEILAQMETPVAGVGNFNVFGAIRALNGPPVEPITREVELNGQRYRTYVFGRGSSAITQKNIFLRGVAVDDELALDESSAFLPNELSSTLGNQNVLIIRVDFSDLPGDPQCSFCGSNPIIYTAGYVQNFADTQIAPFYQQSSYGATSLTNTTTTKLYRMPQTAAYYATNGADDQLHTDAETAASADFTLANFQKVIVLFSSLGSIPNSQITYGGQANIGGPDVWINGEFDFRIVAHELGHTFGLFHANVWQVSDGNPISATGTSVEYADPYDTMGTNAANDTRVDFNAWFKSRLGWILPASIQEITASGTYRVYNFDDANATGILGLTIRKDHTRNYWVTCRRKFTDNASMEHGAYVFWGYNVLHTSDLLDMTTPGINLQDAALALGAQFSDADALITIKPIAEGGTPPHNYLDVAITLVPGPANDDFVNAQILSGSSGSVQGENVRATQETGEPVHAGNEGGASVWFAYTASVDGTLTLDTFGSSLNTLLAVYTGNFVSELNPVASNDDAAGLTQSRVSFPIVAGTTYHIAVDGFNGATGNFVLNFTTNTGVCSISTNSLPANAGLTSGDGNFNGGAIVTVIATANSGYAFVNWTENGVIVSTAASYIFTASTNRVLVANFVPLSLLLNLSTRSPVGTNDNVLIGGFIISGSEPKKIILRAIGPSLGSFGLQGVLADPTLELRDANNALLASNDNWKQTQAAEIIAAGLAPTDDRESVILTTLAPGSYTAITRGVGATTGIGLIEIYDGATNAQSQLANISTRGRVQTDDNVMIGGFILGPAESGAVRVIVRAIGPSLSQRNVPGALQDPTLDLVNSNGALLASNDDWRSTQEQEIIATTLQPGDDRESAIVAALNPGAYTAIVRGKGGQVGVALVELYRLP